VTSVNENATMNLRTYARRHPNEAAPFYQAT
jgi:hypothetical protein